MRWIKGLVPTVIILLGALVLGCICYVSIWGAPSFVVQRVEQALMEKGIPVHIETLKISLWPRAVVTLKNVELLDPGVPPEARRPVALLLVVRRHGNAHQLMNAATQGLDHACGNHFCTVGRHKAS